MRPPERYERAWFIPDPQGRGDGYGGVVVEEGSAGHHWWVLCPATATLVWGEPEELGLGFDDGRGYENPYCSHGDACDHLEWHRAAARFIHNRAEDNR